MNARITTSESPTYCFDASSLIELERSRTLGVLAKLGSRVRVPHRVAREVNKPGTDISQWLVKNPSNIVRNFLPEESALYLRLLQRSNPRIHDGEAAAIALSFHRGWILVIDDRVPRILAEGLGIKTLSTEELLAKPPL